MDLIRKITFSNNTLDRAYNNEEVRLVGGTYLGGWSTVADPAVLNRLKANAQGNVSEYSI